MIAIEKKSIKNEQSFDLAIGDLKRAAEERAEKDNSNGMTTRFELHLLAETVERSVDVTIEHEPDGSEKIITSR